MADTKISALTSAATPLAGTEVLPIVQSGTTKKATVDNVTNRAIAPTSVAIGTPLDGSLQSIGVDGAADGTTYTLNKWTPRVTESTTYDLKFTTRFAGAGASAGWQYDFVSRDFYTGSKNYLRFLGGNTVVPDGNLVIGTSGKGIDFSATPGTGTSELFSDYEEGTWTPVLTGGTTNPTYTVSASETGGRYTKIGNIVYFSFEVRWSAVSGGSGDVIITGLPFTRVNNQQPGSDNFSLQSRGNTYLGDTLQGNINANQTAIYVLTNDAAGGATINLQCLGLGVSGVGFLRGSGFYIASV